MDELWEKTQNPQLHQRWDLRFNQIEYLPREAGEPQKFLYRTRIGFGFTIDGNGESTGTRDGDGDGAYLEFGIPVLGPKVFDQGGLGLLEVCARRNWDSFLYLVRLRN